MRITEREIPKRKGIKGITVTLPDGTRLTRLPDARVRPVSIDNVGRVGQSRFPNTDQPLPKRY